MSKQKKEEFEKALGCCINSMHQGDACGQVLAFERRPGELMVRDVWPDAPLHETVCRYEMILFDGGNSAGDRWKHLFFPQMLEHYFLDENPLTPADEAPPHEPTTVGELMQSLAFFADEHIEDELAELDLECPVGEACAKVLRKAADLIEHAGDVRNELVAVTVRQMNIFYFG